jgi:hypothetical protein
MSYTALCCKMSPWGVLYSGLLYNKLWTELYSHLFQEANHGQ